VFVVGSDRVGDGPEAPKPAFFQKIRESHEKIKLMLLSKRGIHFSSEMLVRNRGGWIAMRVLVIFLLCFALCGAVRADEQAKGWLGAAVEDLSAKDAAKLGMESPHGVIVTRRAAGTPAEKAGLETGDVILSLDRLWWKTRRALRPMWRRRQPARRSSCLCAAVHARRA
jgi:predicted metalloprotease with PDZ domain